MFQDLRRLVFSPAALMKVFEDEAVMLSRLGFGAPPITIEIAPQKCALEICMFDEQKGCIGQVDFSGPALAAVLMAHCKRYGVPLPRRGRKALDYSDGKVALVIETDINIPAA